MAKLCRRLIRSELENEGHVGGIGLTMKKRQQDASRREFLKAAASVAEPGSASLQAPDGAGRVMRSVGTRCGR